MRSLLRSVLIVLLSLVAPLTIAQDGRTDSVSAQPLSADGTERLATMRARLIGNWEEFSPSHNYIDISDDGRAVLYFKKGEVGNLKQLEGTWTLDDTNTFRIEFVVNGRNIAQTAKLSFDGGDMLLSGDDGATSRHRRRNGPLPEEYR